MRKAGFSVLGLSFPAEELAPGWGSLICGYSLGTCTLWGTRGVEIMKAASRAEEARQGMYTGWESPVNTQHMV